VPTVETLVTMHPGVAPNMLRIGGRLREVWRVFVLIFDASPKPAIKIAIGPMLATTVNFRRRFRRRLSPQYVAASSR
jgi:hypothetical protein